MWKDRNTASVNSLLFSEDEWKWMNMYVSPTILGNGNIGSLLLLNLF